MRILLAAKHAPDGVRQIGGVQSWVRTVAAELQKLGHEVKTWGPEQPRPLAVDGSVDHFDLGIFANLLDTGGALDQCARVLNVCHGIIPAERPASSSVVFTSEGVRDHWGGTGPVIRQPIDLNFWTDEGYERSGLLRYSYRKGLYFIAGMAHEMGMAYTHISDVTPEVARHHMQRAACVLASGRAALEAAACGAPVVICDHRGAYQAPLVAHFGTEQAEQNYSGRKGRAPTADLLRGMIDIAMAGTGWREYVAEHHDAAAITAQLLEAAC